MTLHVIGEGVRDGVGAVHCRAVVLASGGLGQVFSQTTNPAVSTGDGMAIALRAGATLRDLEFVQFHPTVMYLGPESRGQQPLISEAVRGEGAFLVDDDGSRFMQGMHELADLAPRDVVAKAIMKRMLETGRPHMWLDAPPPRRSGSGSGRFPTILATTRSHGVDPVTELIPVAPACHYASGGVRTDLEGRTDLPGLYATGEVACSGVHGANRLASNSLLEGLVFSRRIAAVLPGELRPWADAGDRPPDCRASSPVTVRRELQETMTSRVGVLRSRRRARGGDRRCSTSSPATPAEQVDQDSWETTNLVTISAALADAAALREETRGSHWRDDFPDRDDARWAGHFDVAMTDGVTTVTFSPAPPTDTDLPTGSRRMTLALTPYDAVPALLLEELAKGGLDPRATLRPGRRRAGRGRADRGRHQRRDHRRRCPRHGGLQRPRAGCRRRPRRRRAGVPDGARRRRRGHRSGLRRHRGRARRRRADRRRSGAGPAHRRTDRPQLRLPPLRRRHRDRGLGRRPGRHPRPGARHPQDAAGAARAPEVRRRLRRRGQPPVQPVRPGDGQGQPRRSRPAAWCRPTRRCARPTPTCGSRSR